MAVLLGGPKSSRFHEFVNFRGKKFEAWSSKIIAINGCAPKQAKNFKSSRVCQF